MLTLFFGYNHEIRSNLFSCGIELLKNVQCRNIGIYLLNALAWIKVFLYTQKMFFYQGDGYLWPHWYMNNLYSS